MDFSNDIVNYSARLTAAVNAIDKTKIQQFIDVLLGHYESGSQIFIFGNGGSAMTASHAACDFNKGVCFDLEKKFKFICLNDSVATMMAYANDVSYADIFTLQLKNYLKPEDLVIGISGSGNSANVLNALEYAKSKGSEIFSLCGYDGGKLKQIDPDNCLHTAVNDMQIVEDTHLVVIHMVMQILFKHLNKKAA